MKRIVLGMSGGVDSTMSAILLKKAGWEVIGVSLKLPAWQKDCSTRDNACCTAESLDRARRVCEKLDIEYHVVDSLQEFKDEVIDYFVDELKNGRTPNPCMICNRFHKFPELIKWAEERGIEKVASGHYARVRFNEETEKYEMLVAKDLSKDQTYGLAYLTQEQLAKIEFPLGGMLKDEVYQLARDEGLEIFESIKQSQDLCFVAKEEMKDFLDEYIGERDGEIVFNGKAIGKHKGAHLFTIGQKKGLNLPGTYYVKEIDFEGNRVIVTDDLEELGRKVLILKQFNFISGEVFGKVKARIRYGQELQDAELFKDGDALKIVFEEKQIGVAPGQFCVFYLDDVCLGTGMIN